MLPPSLLLIKAFGDFVIGVYAHRLNDKSDTTIVAGSHLLPVAKAMGVDHKIQWIDTGSLVPAFYDMKKRGLLASLKSFYDLQLAINKVKKTSAKIIFDDNTIKEKLLGFRLQYGYINNGSTNIYDCYFDYFDITPKQYAEVDLFQSKKSDLPVVAIIPDSCRVRVRQIPDNLVNTLCKQISGLGAEAKVIRVKPSEDYHPPANEYSTWIYGFPSLIEQIKHADFVISADSLPTHLCEYYSIPVYVFSPTTKLYWLPNSSYQLGRHSTFDKLDHLTTYLNKILQHPVVNRQKKKMIEIN